MIKHFFVLLPLLSVFASADTWTQWRGPNRDGTIQATPWPESFDGLKETWTADLGPGYSGPIVSSNRVFVCETVKKKEELVRALDRATGKEIWKTTWKGSLKVPFFARSNGSWIRSTPALDGNRLYVAGMRDVLVCLNADRGEEVWRVDFTERHDTPLPSFGFVCSPLIVGEHVYVQAGASFVKLDKLTGAEVWRSLVDKGGMYGSVFSSPVLTSLHDQPQLVAQTRTRLAGVHPDDGRELWSIDIKAFRGMNILTPTFYGNKALASTYGGISQLLDISKAGDAFIVKPEWQTKKQGYMSSPIIRGDHAYIHLRNQRVTCLDLRSGEATWTSEPFGKYWSMIANGDRILALDERGELILIKADPATFGVLARKKISDSPTWAHLAVAGDEVFVRALDRVTAYRWRSAE